MSSNGFKQQLFAQFARIGKALSNGNRLEILEYLAQGERCVDDLARLSGLSLANTSQHLQQLRNSGLVLSRKQGQQVFYRINGDDVVELMSALRLVGERHLADVGRLITTYLSVKDELEPIPRDELMDRAAQGLVTILDVRPAQEYAAGHVAGAINVPLAELETYLNHISPEQEIVAYCRGPHCILAYDAVEKLRVKGYKARRLEDGYPEWKTAGLPVD